MFAGAAFTDQADIKATDAVNMLSSLGVITGYTDGSYQPNKVVTRAEMAKMIFVVRNNKIDDSAYQSNYSKLTDISSHWAKGYIKFCESQGIIAGKGNNKFDPDSPVTGVEAAKMLLVVSGYDSAKAGLTGYAQVYGKYNTTPYDKLQMDLMYIAHPSLIEDLKIMLATVKILFMPESTEGVAEGATTAMGQEKCEESSK